MIATNLAVTLLEAGDSTGALQLLEAVHATSQDVFGHEDPRAVAVTYNLAQALDESGDLVGARGMLESILQVAHRIYETGHPHTAGIASTLAAVMEQQGDRVASRTLLEQEAQAIQRQLGAEHPAAVGAAHRLGRALYDQGELIWARAALGSAYAIRERTLGHEHPDTLDSAGDYAAVLLACGDMTTAKDVLSRTHEINRRIFGEDHPRTLAEANNLAECLRAQGELAGARQIHEYVHETQQRTLGLDHARTLVAASNLAETLRAQGFTADARRLHELVYSMRVRVLGSFHRDTLTSANNLAAALCTLGDSDRGLQLYAMASEMAARLLGPEHPDSLSMARNLAAALLDAGELPRAREILERTHADQKRVHGLEHPGYFSSALCLARALRLQGDAAGALTILREAHEGCRKALGADHHQTLSLEGELATAYCESGMPVQGAAHCLSVLGSLHRAAWIDSVPIAELSSLPLFSLPEVAEDPTYAAQAMDMLCMISRKVLVQLRSMPLDSGDALYRSLTLLHRLWADMARQHLPPQQQAVTLISIVAPLHGVHTWAKLRAIALAAGTKDPSDTSHRYLIAAQALQATRAEVHGLLLQRAGWRERMGELRQRLEHLKAVETHQPMSDPVLVHNELAYVQNDLEQLNEKLASLEANGPREQAEFDASEKALVEAEPKLGGVLGAWTGSATPSQIESTLTASEAWLIPLPSRLNFEDVPDQWLHRFQIQELSSPILVLQRDRPARIVDVIRLQALARSSAMYREALRGTLRGALRDKADAPGSRFGATATAHAGVGPGIDTASSLALASLLARQGFWRPLQSVLVGVSRVHLVTGAGQHDLMLECGLPEEFSHVQLLRYCGLPAYLHRAATHAESPLGQTRRAWVSDTAINSSRPIPFTALDAFVPEHRGMGAAQSATDLLDHGPRCPVLILASHGQSNGRHDNVSGCIVLGDSHVEPATILRGQGGWRPLQGLIALSCFAGAVGTSAEGDAHGVIATLQLGGLQWAIACLAPVPDFITPLFSAILHHCMDASGADASTALVQARRFVSQGPWDEALRSQALAPLREAYRALMIDLLQRMRYLPDDEAHNERARALLPGLTSWTLPGRYRRMIDGYASLPELAAAHEHIAAQLPQGQANCRAFVDECLDILFVDPALRADGASDPQETGLLQQALDGLCAVTVFFGKP